MHAVTYSATGGDAPGSGNYMENCVAWSTVSAAFAPHAALYSNFVNNIGFGVYALGSAGYGPPIGSQNVFWYSGSFSPSYETLSDYARVNTNFVGNTVADPKFANAADFDFHLLSAAGYVSNGVWVTNPAVGLQPGDRLRAGSKPRLTPMSRSEVKVGCPVSRERYTCNRNRTAANV